MAKRKITGKDNRKDLEHKSYRIDDSVQGDPEVWQAVCDETTHEKLDNITAALGGGAATKVAAENISAIKLLTLDNPTDVSLSTSDGSCPEATVFGVSRTSGSTGDNIEVITAGVLYDSSFNFPVNAPLFLGINGTITDTAPTTGYLTQIGTSGGPGLINININPPIEL